MKMLKLTAILAAVAMLAGCSSTTGKPADTSAQSQETVQETQNSQNSSEKPETSTSDSQKESAPASSLSDAGTAIKQAFSEKGFTIQDEELDGREYDFEAVSNSGTVDIEMEQFADENSARQAFLNDTSVDVDEELTPGQACVNDKGSLMVLSNNFNNISEIEAVDAQNCITYSIDNISQANLTDTLSVMESIGFSIPE